MEFWRVHLTWLDCKEVSVLHEFCVCCESYKLYFHNYLLKEGAFGFRVFSFGHFLGWFFSFCTEKHRFFSFVVHCGFRYFFIF